MPSDFPLLPRRRILPGGIPRINWADPLTAGLVGCYIPGAFLGRKIYNLTGRGGDLTVNAGSFFDRGAEGMGLNATVNNSGATGLCPLSMQPTNAVSIYWRGQFYGTPAVASINMLGVEYDIFLSSPYLCYSLYRITDTNEQADVVFNTNGNFYQVDGVGAISYTQVGSFGGTVNTAGNAILYSQGVPFNSAAVAPGTMIYSSTSTICLNCEIDTTRILNATAWAGYIWTRELSAREMALLHNDPYRFLIYPDDEIFALKSKTTKTITTSLGAILSLVNLTKTSSLGAFLQKTVPKAASLDSVLFATVPKTSNLGGFLQKTVAKTASLDSQLTKISPFTSLGAILYGRHTVTASFDAQIKHSTQLTASMNMAIGVPVQRVASMDAILFPHFASFPNRTAVISEIPRTVDINY